MYESHFGLSSSPFQLSPEPAFYFESKGHANALSYLKFGVFQGEGFIVVTGEVGAGKTMLVRALLEALNTEQVVAAQLVSTHLEADDLLRAITVAFGIPVEGLSKSQLIGSLEAFFTSLAVAKKRALLIVDEAQNLSPQGIEELRMLSNFQLGSRALLQSFFVGQPELRKLLQLPAMEQFRQRVIASCHLGPLDSTETKSYIEHRLRKAGWNGRPSIESKAFLEIHGASDGIPRRINLLCNRVLLGTFLAGVDVVSADAVRKVAAEFRAEIWSQGQLRESAPARPTKRRQDFVNSAVPPTESSLFERHEGNRGLEVERPQDGTGPVLVLVDSFTSRMKASVLARALLRISESPSALAVYLDPEPREVSAPDEGEAKLPMPPLEIRLRYQAGSFANSAADTMVQFDSVLNEARPTAVIAAGNGDCVLACGLVAAKRGIKIIRVDVGDRGSSGSLAHPFNAEVLDRLAHLIFTSQLTAHYLLYRIGIGSDRLVNAGSLMQDVLAEVFPNVVRPERTLLELGVNASRFVTENGYAVVILNSDPLRLTAGAASAMVAVLRAITDRIAAVCIVDASHQPGYAHLLSGEQTGNRETIAIISPGYLGKISLIGEARVVIADSQKSLIEESALLGVPIVVVEESARGGAESTSSSDIHVTGVSRAVSTTFDILDEGETSSDQRRSRIHPEVASRIAAHLAEWLLKNRSERGKKRA